MRDPTRDGREGSSERDARAGAEHDVRLRRALGVIADDIGGQLGKPDVADAEQERAARPELEAEIDAPEQTSAEAGGQRERPIERSDDPEPSGIGDPGSTVWRARPEYTIAPGPKMSVEPPMPPPSETSLPAGSAGESGTNVRTGGVTARGVQAAKKMESTARMSHALSTSVPRRSHLICQVLPSKRQRMNMRVMRNATSAINTAPTISSHGLSAVLRWRWKPATCGCDERF